MGISHDSLLVIATLRGILLWGSHCISHPPLVEDRWNSVGTGGVGILPDGQLVLLALVDLPRIRWLPMGPWGSPQLVPQHFSTRDVWYAQDQLTTSPWHQQYAAVWVKCQEKNVIIWESWQKRPPWKQQWKNIWSIFPKDWPTLREMNGTSTIGNQIYILKCKFSLQPIN